MNKQKYLILLSLLILSISVYLNSIYGEFLLDDEMLIQKYPVIRSFSMDLITYRVVRTFSYAIDYFFWGLNPLGYHLANLFYNTLTIVVVFLLTRKLVGKLFVSIVTTLLFAVHPIHTEAVSYLSGRRDILTALFYLLGFFFYVVGKQEKRKWYYVLVFLCYILGVLSKEMAITLPLMIFVYEVIDWIERNKKMESPTFFLLTQSFVATVRSFKWFLLSFLFFVLPYLYMVLFFQNASGMVRSDMFGWWGGTPIANFTTVCRVVAVYIQKLFFPIILHPDYHQFPLSKSLLDPKFLVAFLLFIIVICFSFRMLKHDVWFTFSIWWFFVSLLPVMQIIPHHMLMAEHYLYLPSYGFCLGLSLFLFRIFKKDRLKVPVMLFSALLATFFFIRTIDRNQDWQNISTLMKEGLRHSPSNPLYHFFLGRSYSLNKLLVSADRELSKAIGPKHDLPNVHAAKALVAFQQGDYEIGLYETEETLKLDPNHQMAIYNMGYYADKMGDDLTALEYYSRVEPDFESGNALLNAAFLHIKSGNLEEAEESLLKLKNIQSMNATPYFGLADVYTKMFRFDEAIEHYNNVLEESGNMYFLQNGEITKIDIKQVQENLQNIMDLKEKYNLAMAALGKGESSKGHQLLGELYEFIGDYESAEKELKESMHAAEETIPVELLLGEVYLKSDNLPEAENMYNRILESGLDQPPEVLVGAGEFYARTLRFNKANELFRRAMEEDPEDNKIKGYLSWSIRLKKLLEDSQRLHESGRLVESALMKSNVLVSLGKNKNAIEVLENALEADPCNLHLLMNLGVLYEAMGYPYWSKTIATYRHLFSLDPNNAEAYRRLGEFYYTAIEDYESALDCLQKTLVLNPDQEGAGRIRITVDKLQQFVSLYLGG